MRQGLGRGVAEETEAAEAGGGVAREEGVVGQAQGRGGRVAVALLRHEAGPVAASLGDAEAPGRNAVERHHAGLGCRSLAGQRIEQFGLPVAGDARDADDSPRPIP